MPIVQLTRQSSWVENTGGGRRGEGGGVRTWGSGKGTDVVEGPHKKKIKREKF